MKHILVIEDDTILNKALTWNLKAEGYAVDSAYCGSDAEQYFYDGDYSLVILDVNLPDENGYDLCRKFKEQKKEVPIIFLTGNDRESDMLRGYEIGGSDYVTKPFPISVFSKKVRVLLGLMEKNEPDYNGFDDGNLKIDFSDMTVFCGGEQLHFTALEMRTLSVLIENAGILMTKQRLLEWLWDRKGKYVDEHTLATTISRIRGKIGEGYIETVYGMGYLWAADKSRKGTE